MFSPVLQTVDIFQMFEHEGYQGIVSHLILYSSLEF